MDVKISVIIPVYNAEKYIRQCIKSVLDQTLKSIEIICIDDVSKDNSYEILKEYAKKDNRIALIKNEKNLGAGETRNRGLKLAKGEYIHFLDADDYLIANAYELMYEKARKSNADILKAKAYSIDAVKDAEIFYPRYYLLGLGNKDFRTETNFHKEPKKTAGLPVTPWGGIYKRKFLIDNDIYFNNLKSVNDRSFSVLALIRANTITFLDSFILYYRIDTPGSLVGSRGKNFECLFMSYNIIEKQCGGLLPDERFYILESALNDMFYWYRKYQNESLLKDEIYKKTKDFIDSLDISVFEGRMELCRWHLDYLRLKGIKPYPIYRLKRFIKGSMQALPKLFRLFKRYGLKSAFSLTVIKKNK